MNDFARDIKKALHSQVNDKHHSTVTFESLWSKHQGGYKNRLNKKVVAACVASLAILVPVTAVAGSQFHWSHISFSVSDPGPNTSAGSETKTPVDTFVLGSGLDPVSLPEMQKESAFSIRVPQSVQGWTRVTSTGAKAHGSGALSYWDFYQDSQGNRVVVIQTSTKELTDTSKQTPGGQIMKYPVGLPSNANVKYSGNDFVSTVNLPRNQHEMVVYHKESDESITLINIYGNVPVTELDSFHKAYVNSNVGK